MTDKLKNFRVQNGCHNCISMEDLSDYGTGYLFLCKLQFPNFNRKDYHARISIGYDDYVDENGVCDNWGMEQI